VILLNEISFPESLGLRIQRLDRLASIGTLSAGLAHEIKNALVAVTTFVQDLVERNKDSELAELVSRELRRIDSIVSQMLNFAGPPRPSFAVASVHGIVDQCLRLIHPQLEAKQIHLHRAFGATRDGVEGDEYQLEQALLNVFLNALAAMDAQGQLDVETSISERHLQSAASLASGPSLFLTISDSGAGIPPENLSRLFEPFFSTKPHGTGLGLPITRRIIVEHRGEITVESELGKGTTFRIILPLAASPA
jgi:signal transduction histidine kinase